MIANTRQSYGLIAQILHWLTAGLILILLPLGIYMHELPTSTPVEVDSKIWLYSLHKTLGILAFATAILRVLWAMTQVSPGPLNAERRFETLLAGTIHWLLYGSIILMPITGWLHHASLEGFAPIWWPFSQDLSFVSKDPDLAKLFGAAHQFTAITLIGSLVLHIVGALKHVVFDKDQTLSRMLPWKRIAISTDLAEAPNKSQSRLLAGSIFAALAIVIVGSQINFGQSANTITEITSTSAQSGWVVDHEKSNLNIEIIQSGQPVKGNFAEWQADIVFDLDALDKASVTVTVNTASLTVGGVTKDALSGNFLNVLEFPQAVFTSDEFTEIGEGKYQAVGELSLAGITKPLTMPFDLTIENDKAFMQGKVELQRLDYGLGAKGYTTDGLLGFVVKVNVFLEASAK